MASQGLSFLKVREKCHLPQTQFLLQNLEEYFSPNQTELKAHCRVPQLYLTLGGNLLRVGPKMTHDTHQSSTTETELY